jgi:DNA-binding NarL/FixJ family response regulator
MSTLPKEVKSHEAFAEVAIYLPHNPKQSFNTYADAHYIVEPAVLDKIFDILQQNSCKKNTINPQNVSEKTSVMRAQHYLLSLKEKQVLQLLAKGYSYKMIASELNKSIETIRVQLKKIYKKLQVHSNTGAIFKLQNLES